MFINAKIETIRLILRPYCLEDVDDIYTIVNENDFYQYIPEEVPTHEDVKKIIEWSIKQNQRNTADKIYKFTNAIIHKKDNKIIGYCGLGPDDLGMGQIELYYGISSEYRRLGLAREAARAIIKYGFEVIGLDRIVAFVHYENLSSLKLLESLGMSYHFRINNLDDENKNFDGHCYYTITKQQFK